MQKIEHRRRKKKEGNKDISSKKKIKARTRLNIVKMLSTDHMAKHSHEHKHC